MKNTCSKCNELLEDNRIGKQRYCKHCHAKWMRQNRPKHKELNPIQKLKANARSYVNTYVIRGTLKKENCLICASKYTEAHHEDYSKPLQVIWMCRKCHLQYHSFKP